MGDPVLYDFDVVSGTISLDTEPNGLIAPDPVTVNADGTFAITIFQSNGHVDCSDTFLLEDARVYNAETIQFVLAGGLATATIQPGSLEFLDFAPDCPAHIGVGGQACANADALVGITDLLVTGLTSTPFTTVTWAGTLLPFNLSFTTSVMASDVLWVTLNGTFPWETVNIDISSTITLDLIIDVVGTAHMVPDPALGGLTVLGVSAAALWLRRRRA
ncbi:MAG: hypothetical protein JXQ73_31520 [Phycisphaerae bacterium]|nr:hypothetical protein [Phycisphaerae bacterium]